MSATGVGGTAHESPQTLVPLVSVPGNCKCHRGCGCVCVAKVCVCCVAKLLLFAAFAINTPTLRA